EGEHFRCSAVLPISAGEMAEWLKAHAWKACLGETLTWVRIPLSPPSFICGARAPCNAVLQTPPGPEGSNGTQVAACAAGSLEPHFFREADRREPGPPPLFGHRST